MAEINETLGMDPVSPIGQPIINAFYSEYSRLAGPLQEAFIAIEAARPVPVKDLSEIAHYLTNLTDTPNILNLLHYAREKQDPMLQHSLNVALVAGCLVKWLDLPRNGVMEAVFAGLLHDLGKMLIPESILLKPEKLLPYEQGVIRCHPFHGYQLIQSSMHIPQSVKLAVLQHHERLDGSGYPARLKLDEISFLSQVIAVADIYDAMMSERPYRPALAHIEVMEELANKMYVKLDASVCIVLLDKLKQAVIGNQVQLDDGRIAKIVRFDKLRSPRPLLQFDDGDYLDLSRNPRIRITDVISSEYRNMNKNE